MRLATKTAKSFTIDKAIEKYVSDTRGEQSASERVNDLLRRAILQERMEKLEAEAAEFFSKTTNADRMGTRAFQKASMRTLNRD